LLMSAEMMRFQNNRGQVAGLNHPNLNSNDYHTKQQITIQSEKPGGDACLQSQHSGG
jgi:hypothetical protein